MSSTEDYLRDLAETTRKYMQELRHENEELRTLLGAFTAGAAPLAEQLASARRRLEEERRSMAPATVREEQLAQLVDQLHAELEVNRAQRDALLRKVGEIEAQCRRTANQYADVEQQYANLTNLFVASQSLHQTLDRAEVLQSLQEIVINIIGSEELAVFELGANGRSLELVASYGVDALALAELTVDTGVIGRTVRSGETWIAGESELVGLPLHETRLTAVVPLRLSTRVIGAIAIFRLLRHKPSLTNVDHELFDLLATQAATALYCTRLCEAEQRAQAGRR